MTTSPSLTFSPSLLRHSQAQRCVTTQPLRVLIVDDAPSTRRIVRAVLERSRDFDVVGEASDGRWAIEMSEALQPDLVLLDLFMPFVNGIKALKKVLRGAPRAKVVVFSGMKSVTQEQMIDAGAVGFIAKGITPTELLDRLGAILG
jgi:DNA-binding NarL/FixJ family response regulator